jgi:predicted HicB family RNase H-like nuclease
MPNQPTPGSRGHFISSIPDPLWEQAQTVAADRGESVSAAIRRALEEYVKQPKESTT